MKRNLTEPISNLESGSLWEAGGTPWLNLMNARRLAALGYGDVLADATSAREFLTLDEGDWSELDTDSTLAALRVFQELTYRVSSALLSGQVPPSDALESLARICDSQSLAFEPSFGDSPHMELKRRYLRPEHVLGEAAESLAQYIISGDKTRLRKCANPECRMVFLDETKNGKRRWCSMSVCGNRSKVKNYKLRREANETATE